MRNEHLNESRELPAEEPSLTELAIRELGKLGTSHEQDPAGRLEAILAIGCRALGLSTGIVSRIYGDHWAVVAAEDAWGQLEPGEVLPLAERYCALAVAAAAPIAFSRATGTPWADYAQHRTACAEAYMGVALYVNGQRFGTLAFQDPSARPREFAEIEFDLLRLLAHFVTSVLERGELKRMKSEFLSVVSHELRTPLTSVRGALGLLASGRMGRLDPQGQRMLEIAGQNTDRVVRIINDILDLERMQSGKMEMQMSPVSSAALIRSALDEMRPVADRAGVVLETEVDDEAVSAHHGRIVQVLNILIGNAIKYSSPGGTVCVRALSTRGGVRFEVTDCGQGIPEDRLDRIFEQFEQVDSSDSRGTGGSGLGLALARGIVRQHGGGVGVESRVGVGSRFYFTLTPPVQRSARPAPEPPLILICDDDPAICRFLQLILDARGYRTRTSQSGEEIIALATEQHPAVILLDFQLSGIDGRDTLSLLRQWPGTRDVPVIMLSGHPREASGIAESEIVAWIEKPIDQAALLDALIDALRKTPLHADVLVVEDDEGLAQVLTESLVSRGISSYHAQSGSEAIRLATTLPFALLILDVGLPDTDGFAVIASMRSQPRLRDLPLLIFTAAELDERERARLRMGPTEFLVKSQHPIRHLGDRALALLGRSGAAVMT